MTQLLDLSDRLALNPEATYPPFPVFLDLPADWTLLDTNPSTWERSAQDMLQTTFRAPRLSAVERREVMAFFEQLVADCQQAGTALSIIQVGRLDAGGAGSLGIHLAFVDERQPVDLARTRDSLVRSGTVTEVTSGVGPALLQRERATMVPPGATEVVAMTSLQIHMPIPGTTWLAVLATASAHAELTDPVERLLRRIAAGFRLTEQPQDPDGDGTDDQDDDQDTAETDAAVGELFTEAPRASGPGIERGFTTFVRKSLDPAPDEPGDAR